MKIENTEVYGFRAAIRAMRNPKDSWELSDSFISSIPEFFDYWNIEKFNLGEKDMMLSQSLAKSGSEHCKHLRMIHVWVDITLPRFVWAEFDTYKFNTKVSCSTMHTIHKRVLTQEDFEYPIPRVQLDLLNNLILNRKTIYSNNEEFLRDIKNILPEGFLQKRTVDLNYAELANIYHQRKTHRLPQWQIICRWIEQLPYFTELTGLGGNK